MWFIMSDVSKGKGSYLNRGVIDTNSDQRRLLMGCFYPYILWGEGTDSNHPLCFCETIENK